MRVHGVGKLMQRVSDLLLITGKIILDRTKNAVDPSRGSLRVQPVANRAGQSISIGTSSRQARVLNQDDTGTSILIRCLRRHVSRIRRKMQTGIRFGAGSRIGLATHPHVDDRVDCLH